MMLLDADKDHLEELINQYEFDFEYLRAEKKVLSVKQSQKDMFYWKDNKMTVRGRRRIYYNVEYEEEQKKAIKEIMQLIPKQGIFLKLTPELILKHLHVQNFSISGTLDRLRDLQAFYYSPITKLNNKTVQNLKKGIFYTFGYTKNYRPIIILRVDKIKKDFDVQEIFNTLYYFMTVLTAYKMEPYHSEKYIMIMDLNHMNVSQIPYPKIYACLTKLSLYSCGFTDQNFVLNASGIWPLWTLVKTILPESAIKKVAFLDNMTPLLDIIDPNELEQKYGGTFPNIQQGEFWPPVASKKSISQMQKSKYFEMSEQTDFYSVCNDENIFTQEQIDLTSQNVKSTGSCCGNWQCTIY